MSMQYACSTIAISPLTLLYIWTLGLEPSKSIVEFALRRCFGMK